MSAPFSRLQLAAALIEYDNDSEEASTPQRSAQDSAIFLPFRNRPIRPERKSTDYLGVTLPNDTETGSIAPRDSLAFDRRPRSRASVDALRNPFGRDSTYDGGLEDDEEEEDLEVDLASWGLDALVPKDEEKERTKRKKDKSEILPNPHLNTGAKQHARTMSVGMLSALGEGGAFLDAQPQVPSLGPRRHSIGDPLDAPIAYSNEPLLPPRARSPSAHAVIDNLTLSAPLHSVPFPSRETVRSSSPQVSDHRRALSVSSRAMLTDDPRPLSPDRASRLDPRSLSSSGSISRMLDGAQPESDNPFALRPPSPSRMSRFDPKAQRTRTRTMSHGSLATQMLLDDERDLPEGNARPSMGERRYSRMDLMRPKVLIMPSPLQSAMQARPSTSIALRTTEGFELSAEGRPLPPGARAARRSSVTLSVLDPGLSVPVASNSFTPNPRSSLTLSQLTFRNTLLVDGQRDVAYADIDGHIKRAIEDGEQIEPEPEPEPERQPEIPIVQVEEPSGPKRPAGKLYGRSLIDDLEQRKADMRGKQRTFRGDDRPSMMARAQTARSSTLITPEDLKRPTSQHMNSFNSSNSLPNITRRNSANVKPLLDLNEDIPGAPRAILHPGGGMASTRSVFGVDTIWERELAKLKVIEEQERKDEEERVKHEAAEEAKGKKGKKKKGKGKEKDEPSGPVSPPFQTPSSAIPDHSSAPPVLPAIPKTIVRRAPPPPADDDDESDEDSDASDAPAPDHAQAAGWLSDEDEGPRRTTGTGPRYPKKSSVTSASGGPPHLSQIGRPEDDSSEEDVPLVATIGRAAQRQAGRAAGGGDDSSDEEQPLAALLDKTRQKLPSLGGGSLSPRSLAPRARDDVDDDDDEQPLGLRVSRFGPSLNASSTGGVHEDEDEQPLGMHPEQLRKSQFYMAQAQQQQQQMFAQAQFAQMAAAQQSMIFGAPSMMSSGFFGPPMAPSMMMYPPQLPPTPPPGQDASKFGRVDKWRQEVAVEGEQS